MQSNTAFASRIMIHTVLKAVFFHVEFGMSAGMPRFSCHLIQNGNASNRPRLITSMAMVPGCEIFDVLADSVAKTYEKRANEALTAHAPIQSISLTSLFQVDA